MLPGRTDWERMSPSSMPFCAPEAGSTWWQVRQSRHPRAEYELSLLLPPAGYLWYHPALQAGRGSGGSQGGLGPLLAGCVLGCRAMQLGVSLECFTRGLTVA